MYRAIQLLEQNGFKRTNKRIWIKGLTIVKLYDDAIQVQTDMGTIRMHSAAATESVCKYQTILSKYGLLITDLEGIVQSQRKACVAIKDILISYSYELKKNKYYLRGTRITIDEYGLIVVSRKREFIVVDDKVSGYNIDKLYIENEPWIKFLFCKRMF